MKRAPSGLLAGVVSRHIARATLALACAAHGCASPASPSHALRPVSPVSARAAAPTVRVTRLPGSEGATALAIVVEGVHDLDHDAGAVGSAAADALHARGAGAAWVRFALARDGGAARAGEVESAVGALRAESKGRTTLIGLGDGAPVVASIALRTPAAGGGRAIDGVIGIRATYAGIDVARADAAPPFLLLSGGDGATEWAQGARRFARALEAAGARHVECYVAAGRDDRTIASLAGEKNEVGRLVSAFVAAGPAERSLDGPWGVQQRWGRSPPLEHEAFWSHGGLVRARAVDDAFRAAVLPIFVDVLHELLPWALREYKALPLREYLATRPERELGSGSHLVIENVLGERLYLTRADVEQHAPEIVIGVDDERNLFRIATSYRLSRQYSWQEERAPLPVMIRALGPFLHFPKGAPPHLRDTTLAGFGLLPGSFRFAASDPLGTVRGLAPDVRDALTGGDGCLKCHMLRGAGARAHHVRASDGRAHGGHAKPLEEYPRPVLERFLFHQEEVAATLGVAPLLVPEPAARALLALATGR